MTETEDKANEKPEDKAEDKADGKSEGNAEDKAEGNAEGKTEKKTEDKPGDKTENKTEGKTEDKSEDKSEEKKEDVTEDETNAATTIQRNYRGYKSRREMNGCGMSAAAKWRELLKDTQFSHLTKPQDSKETGRSKWSRATGVADRLNADEDSDSDVEEEKGSHDFQYYFKLLKSNQRDGRNTETMGPQYWLEMVDRKHRYGFNLLQYHKVWEESDTQDNFFKWLDEGDGKEVDLEGTPRKKLEEQQVQYLTREQRYNYLINVGDDGLLYWAKNGEKVTTHDPEEEDATDGVGGKTETSNHATADLMNTREILKGAELPGLAVVNKVINMMPANASWIFVVDTVFRIYAGIKEPGGFNHSSFLHGSRVLTAGRISVQDGQLLSLSPHSGHYRPRAENFWITTKCLEADGVDMSKCAISGSYAILRGTELYANAASYLSNLTSKSAKETE